VELIDLAPKIVHFGHARGLVKLWIVMRRFHLLIRRTKTARALALRCILPPHVL
jgi:hypothetical protein